MPCFPSFFFFFFNDTATTEIYTLSLHDALPISRYLGCAVVLVKSFARIHETNLKKQGILPLTFKDPRDYDRFGPQDRVSVTGLATLAPGKPTRSCGPKRRSEEHTSELQSLAYLVCRLL